MPDIKLKNQPFDVAFHPTSPILYTSLLTGEVKAFRYDDTLGESSSTSWTARPTRRTARAVVVNQMGESVWVGGKSGALFRLDAESGKVKQERAGAHETPINRLFCVNENLLASGDDEGLIRFWDPRKEDCIRSYNHHQDYISDFCYFDDKRQLVSTSGDGRLSVIDIRVNKTVPLAISEDQEDELLSLVPIKGGTKLAVGTGLGVSGWGDCVDRVPGHPASIDALVALTPDVIATGSEDGMIRVLQLLPNKFLGVIATHEDYPIERLKLDRNAKWLASVSHDLCIKLTDVEDMFEESDEEMEEENVEEEGRTSRTEVNGDVDMTGQSDTEEDDDEDEDEDNEERDEDEGEEKEGEEESEEEEQPKKKKEVKKGGKGGSGDMGRVRQDDATFFDDL
ncbi:hypothetical protein TREMEDRAFT_59329 [Tremella mesenterica DSM 1558]|uniref:uncharacterized protein n=1 Tax=Tremella mesenterica (strain ATCC 24925 / CBS 8224 / DSM 1558 / NBRC 9311 / NRRL Y-6157 / RJB 2259-6 / UBC 559-6) TaxID=578456 RepID=UPI0003F49FA0|nr:uncharacterized protein TREMEDRAFT_59329 [Tremella mesenterica DSM 1558]EIW73167.1 hypothetical protein TREMEDRAFT_59329 [Tremella mesenterica DSM 1558]